MKLLHVTQGYNPAIGGTERLVQRVSEELVRQFSDSVTVFTTNCYNAEGFSNPFLPHMKTGDQIIHGVCVRRFPVVSPVSGLARVAQKALRTLKIQTSESWRTFAQGPYIPGIEAAIQRESADLIMAASFPLMHMYSALSAATKLSRPCVLHGCIHPEDTLAFQRKMILEAIRAANHYMANTEYEADFLIRQGISREKITVIGIGVDLETFDGFDTQQTKRELGFGSDPVVGFIGQLGRYKGVDTLLRAAPVIWEKCPEVRFLIAGGRTTFTRHLEHQVQQFPARLQERIVFKYNFAEEEKPRLFSSVDVIAYPSGFESFGITFLEAWAARKPVVGCAQGAIPCVVRDNVDGILVQYQHEQSLANAITDLLNHPQKAAAMAEEGYQKTAQRYTWARIAPNYRHVYERILNA